MTIRRQAAFQKKGEPESLEPTSSYVIVGARDGWARELTAWTLSEDRIAFFQKTMGNSWHPLTFGRPKMEIGFTVRQ